MANAFVHVELSTTDAAKAKAFYSKVFSWKLEDMPIGPGMTYTMIRPGKGPEGASSAVCVGACREFVRPGCCSTKSVRVRSVSVG